MRIRSFSNCGSESSSKNWKILQLKKKLFLLPKIAIYLFLGLYKRRSSYRRSLQPSKENIQHFKNIKFLCFLFLWVIFALMDPDPDPAIQINAEPCGSGSGSTTLRKTLKNLHSCFRGVQQHHPDRPLLPEEYPRYPEDGGWEGRSRFHKESLEMSCYIKTERWHWVSLKFHYI